MTTVYLDSNASGANDGTSWTDAYTTFQAALNGWGTGDEVWMAKAHTESFGTSTTFTGGTIAEPIPVFRRDPADDSYAPAFDTAGIQNIITTTSNDDIGLQSIHMFGVNVRPFRSLVNSSANSAFWTDCQVTFGQNNSGITMGSSIADAQVGFKTCRIASGAFTQQVKASNGNWRFSDCVFTGGVVSTGLVQEENTLRSNYTIFERCDFSGLSSASIIMVNASGWTDAPFKVEFNQCYWPTPATSFAITDSVTPGSTFNNDEQQVIVKNSDNTVNRYKNYFEDMRGKSEFIISSYRTTGGFVAEGQSQNASVRIEAAAVNCFPYVPAVMTSTITQWITATGNVTVKVQCWDTATVASTDAEAWLEIYVMDTTNVITAIYTTQVKHVTGSALTTSAEGWTTPPGTGRAVEFESGTINVGKIGFIQAKVFFGRAGENFLVDPTMLVA